MMQAMQLPKIAPIEQAPLKQVEVPVPEPGRKQLLLRVHLCGVCHTDLHTVEGDLDLPHLPIVPGHQVVATVEKTGRAVKKHQEGDRVGVAWLYRTCRECEFCQNGQENLCPQAEFTGLHTDGGYAQHLVVDEDYAYPLPATFTDAEAAPLLCAGIIGYRSLRLSGIQPGQRLGLYGFGSSAHLAIQVARFWDCEVFVFTRSTSGRELARELGAVWAGGAEEQIDAGLHASVIFAPAGWIVPVALGHLRPGGTVAINAIHMSDLPSFPYRRIYGERGVRSVANFTRKDAHECLQLAADIPIRPEVEVQPLDQANQVLQRMKNSAIRGSAALQPPQDI
jgi:propanol-preferring alcohol dehydrogenase